MKKKQVQTARKKVLNPSNSAGKRVQDDTRQPLVSVIMPAYNATEYMTEAVESIVGQTYPNLELIIVNDRSTDATLEMVEKYTKDYPEIVKVVSTKKQSNAAGNGAMNYGLQFARGEYIARMDADDVAYPTRIAEQVAYMQTHPDVVVLGSQATVIDKQGKAVGEKRMPVSHENIYKEYGVFHPMIHPTVMFRRSLLPNPNTIYQMRFDVNDDYYTFFGLLEQGSFHNLDKPLLYYRMHGNNLSLQHPKSKFFNSVKIRWAAVRELGYRMSLKAWVLMAAQILVLFPLPEKLIVPLYMWVRGIKSAEVKLPQVPLFKKMALWTRS